MFNKTSAKKRMYDVMYNCGIHNKRGEMFKIKTIEEADYGCKLTMEPSPGLTYKQIEKNLSAIQDSYGCLLEYKANTVKKYCELNVITKEFKKKDFEIIKFEDGHYLYLGNGIDGKPIIVDMNTFPHLLISGLPGSGKTRLLLCILFSLIYGTDKVQLYLTQIRKHDLDLLKEFPAVKQYSTTIEEAENMFRELLEIAEERERLFVKTKCINIAHYNKMFPENPLDYIVAVAEEMSTFMADDSDEGDEKDSKKSCVAVIKKLAILGRSAGVFIIGCLQRTTADNINPSIKYLLQNKITFNMGNTISSTNVIESDMAVGLGQGETIYFNGGEYKRALVPWITDEKIGKLCSHPEDTVKQSIEEIIPKKIYYTPPSVRIDTTAGEGRRYVEEYKLSKEDQQAYIEEIRRKREAKIAMMRAKQKEKEEKIIIEAAIKETKADIDIAEAIEEELAEKPTIKIDYSKVPAPSTPPAPPKEVIVRDERRMPAIGQMQPARNNRRKGQIR